MLPIRMRKDCDGRERGNSEGLESSATTAPSTHVGRLQEPMEGDHLELPAAAGLARVELWGERGRVDGGGGLKRLLRVKACVRPQAQVSTTVSTTMHARSSSTSPQPLSPDDDMLLNELVPLPLLLPLLLPPTPAARAAGGAAAAALRRAPSCWAAGR